MTDTPKTDKQPGWHYDEMGKRIEYVAIGFARQLERERDEAREEIEGLHYALKQSSTIYDVVTEQRDRLAEALEYILGIGLTEKTRAKAEKALQND